MSSSALAFIIIGVLILLPPLIGVFLYNRLIELRNRYRNAFSQIDVQLKRRYELIPNLVETAKAYLSHERETLEAVVTARNQAMSSLSSAEANPGDSQAIRSLAAADTGLNRALGGFFGLSENYPELRSNQNILNLSEELSSTENKVAFARQAYNDAVMSYNTKRETFPAIMVAAAMKFPVAEQFVVSDNAEREAVKVKF